jgi:purine nucleoside permease
MALVQSLPRCSSSIWYVDKLKVSRTQHTEPDIEPQFSDEGAAWYGIPEFDILAQNITVPGISPLFPQVHCTADGQICQVTTGEGGKIKSSLTRNRRLIEGLEINAAITVNSIAYSPLFDLRQTYFLIAGIAGVSPKVTTIGVSISRRHPWTIY